MDKFLEVIAKIGFGPKITSTSSAQARRDQVSPQSGTSRLIDSSLWVATAGIRKYFEDLKRRPNAAIGFEDTFEMTSNWLE
jgi:hypothetical protein